MRQVYGNELRPDVQDHAKRMFVHRFTKEHVPDWSKKPRANGKPYKVQFASDADWLAHTQFWIRNDGELANNKKYCHSSPTWPEGTD